MYLHFKILFFACLFAFTARGQIIVKRAPSSTQVQDYNLDVLGRLKIPVFADTSSGLVGNDSLGMIIYSKTDGKMFVRDTTAGGHKWTAVGTGSGGGSTDTTSLSNRINLKVDSVTIGTDTTYYWTHGTRHFGYKGTISLATLLSVLGYAPLAPTDTVSLSNRINAKLSTVATTNSAQGNGTPASPVQLAGDVNSPGASKYYGTDGSGAKGWNSLPSGVAGANPTAQVGVTPVNGSASTYMRSDAAPSLDTTGANIHTDGFNLAKYKRIADSTAIQGYVTHYQYDTAKQNIRASTDTTNYRSSGSGSPGSYNPTFNYSQSGGQTTITWIPNRDSLDLHSTLAPDSVSVRYVQAHDTISGHALATKYGQDSMRANLYAALAGKVANLGASTGIKAGAYLSRPSASNSQSFYWSTDSAFWSYDGAGPAWKDLKPGSGGGGGTPAGSNKQVQINNSGSFGVVTNFTADASTQTVNADTLITHKVKVDSAIWTVSTWGPPDKMYFLGDSWTFGVRPDGTIGLFKTRLGVYYNLPVTDASASGTGIAQAVTTFNTETIPVAHFTHVLTGLNDPRYSTNLAMAATLNEIINGHYMLYCIQYAKTAIQANTSGSGIRRGGSGWSNTAYNDRLHTGRGTGVQTAIVGDSIMLDFTDSAAFFAIVGSDANGATFDVYVDTVKIYQLTSNARADGISKQGVIDHYIEFPVIVRGLSYAAHTLKLVKTSSSTADSLRVDFGGVMKGVKDANTTPMLICEQPLLDVTGYGTSPSGSSVTTARTANVKLDSFFYSRGVDRRYPFRLGRENQGFAQGENQGQGQGQDTLRTFSTDHIHPNSLGDTGQVRICVNQFPTLDPGRFLAKVKPNGQYLRTNYSGVDRDLAYEDEISMFFSQDLASLTATAGAINVSNNTIAMGTSSNGTTVGNSPITISSGTNVGIGQSSATSVLDVLTTNNGIRVKNGSNAIGMGLFGGSAAIWWNRDYTSGTINSASIPAAAIEGTNQGRLNFSTGVTNGAAPVNYMSITPAGKLLIGNVSSPSDNTSFGSNFPLQNVGGTILDARLITQNNDAWVYKSDGQGRMQDSAGAYNYLWWITKTGARAYIFGWGNNTHSMIRDTALSIDTSNNVKITSALQVVRTTHNIVMGYNAVDDGLNKGQVYGTFKVADTLKLTKLPNKATLAGTDSALIADASGNVHKVPSSAVGGSAGYTTVQNNASSITARSKINLPSGSGLTFTDNSGNTSSDLTITSIPSSATATTQTARDSSTKVATAEYVDRAAQGAAGPYVVAAGTNVASVTAGTMRYTVVDSIVTVNVRGAWDVTTANSISTINVTLPVTCSSYPSREGSYMGSGTWYSAGTSDLVPIGALMTNSTTVQLFCKPPVTTSTSFSATFMYHQ